jgi:hypothetical protein
MPSARACRQKWRYFIEPAAAIAAVFLLAAVCSAQGKPGTGLAPQSESSGRQTVDKYPGLLPAFAQLLGKLENNVQFPAPRAESRLLPLLPASTVIYGAFPNYGQAAHQALGIFRQEFANSAVLGDWWHSSERASSGPKIEEFLDKFYQLHQYLGDEIVVFGVMEGRSPELLVVAEVRKPGLKKFLEQVAEETGGEWKAGVRVLDLEELAAAREEGVGNQWQLLVRPDFVIGAEKLEVLRTFNTSLDKGSREFAAAPFGRRVWQEYQGGVTVLAGADLEKILEQTSVPATREASFERSGFADVKYLISEHRGVGAQGVSQVELSFTGPRHGTAAWLAKPAPLGSLDFVSPNALAAVTLRLTSWPQIFDDLRELAGPSSDPFAAVAGGEKALRLSVKDDLLNCLGGELSLELDSIAPPKPAWKALLSVKDAARLERAFGTLLALTQLPTADREEGGITVHSVTVPSSPVPSEITYAFADGYLIVGSSREGVARAVRLHRSGEGLAKSARFLATRPAGHSPDASGMVYEDPLAMAALQLRQAAPEMAEALAQVTRDSPPAVFYLYGDEGAIREASSGSAFDVGTILVVAAIAIPNLLRSRIAANEASAVGSLRTVNTAEVTYEASYPKRGFAPNLAALGFDPRDRKAYSPEHAGLIDATLAKENCTGDAWCTKTGFQFKVTAVCKQGVCTDYLVLATPVNPDTGTRSFCSTSDGLIRWTTSPALTAPMTIADCRTWRPLP